MLAAPALPWETAGWKQLPACCRGRLQHLQLSAVSQAHEDSPVPSLEPSAEAGSLASQVKRASTAGCASSPLHAFHLMRPLRLEDLTCGQHLCIGLQEQFRAAAFTLLGPMHCPDLSGPAHIHCCVCQFVAQWIVAAAVFKALPCCALVPMIHCPEQGRGGSLRS